VQERHPLTCFAKPGAAAEDTPAPKRRALLLTSGRGDTVPLTYQVAIHAGHAATLPLSCGQLCFAMKEIPGAKERRAENDPTL
jgi:hypothetical protein